MASAEAGRIPGDTSDWEEDTSWFEEDMLTGSSSAGLLVGSSPVGSRMLRDKLVTAAASVAAAASAAAAASVAAVASPSLLAGSVVHMAGPVEYKIFT